MSRRSSSSYETPFFLSRRPSLTVAIAHFVSLHTKIWCRVSWNVPFCRPYFFLFYSPSFSLVAVFPWAYHRNSTSKKTSILWKLAWWKLSSLPHSLEFDALLHQCSAPTKAVILQLASSSIQQLRPHHVAFICKWMSLMFYRFLQQACLQWIPVRCDRKHPFVTFSSLRIWPILTSQNFWFLHAFVVYSEIQHTHWYREIVPSIP